MRDDEAVIHIVYEACKQRPKLLPEIINAATAGIKEFSESQRDVSASLAYPFFDILERNWETLKTGPFSKKELLELLAPWFKTAPAYEKMIAELE